MCINTNRLRSNIIVWSILIIDFTKIKPNAVAYNRIPFFSIAECVAFCPNFGKSASPLPYNGPIYFSSTTILFVMCVGIGSVQMGEPSICNKHGCGSPRASAPADKWNPASPAPGSYSRRDSAAWWQVTVSPVFFAARFPTVLPVATFHEVKKHCKQMAIMQQSTK